MEATLIKLNRIAGTSYTREDGDIAPLNAICIQQGGTGGHTFRLQALNELCVLLGGTTHEFEMTALNDICAQIGGTTHQFEESAWEEIESIGLSVNTTPVVVDQTFNINENSANSTAIGTVVTNDPGSSTFEFAIQSGNTGSTFAINSSSGTITVNDNTNLTHAYAAYRDLVIRVSNAADSGLYDDATIRIYVRIPLTRNADTVEASGYYAINTTTVALGWGATPPRYYLNKNNLQRVRQNGSITHVKFYYYQANITVIYFQVWRKDGTTYDLIHSVDITADLIEESVNTITLASPVAVQEGDFVGLGGSGAADLTFVGVSGQASNSLRYTTNETPGSTDFAWDSKNALAYLLPMKTYQQAPLMAAIGDSIIAGHPDHYSFVEAILKDSLTSSISYQLKQLDANYIYQNMGIGGQPTGSIVSRFTADLVNLKPKIALINGGVNDIAAGVAKAATLANWETMLDACDAAGIYAVCMKVLPWTNGTTVQMQNRDALNTDLQALVATHANTIWVACDSEVGQYRAGGDANNLWDIKTEYNSDGVHFNVAGYTKIAEVIHGLISKKFSF